MAANTLPKAITKEVLLNAIQNKLMSCAKMFWDPNVTAQQMYEDLTCSVFSGSLSDDFPDVVKAEQDSVLDENLCFKYKGYEFELSSCTILTNKEQMLGLSNDNFKQRFPHGVFTDRYVCWIYGHRDSEGYTKEESDEPDYWSPEIYLVPGAWLWGASTDLKVGSKVDKQILTNIDKFLETFNEEVHDD